jgi:hypothetical protein
MSDNLKKGAAVGFLAFLVLWAAGVGRTFTLGDQEVQAVSPPVLPSLDDLGGSRARSANNLRQIGLTAPLPLVLDREDINQIRVYEKTALLAAATAAFHDDEERLRKAVAAQHGVIFSERTTGIAPERSLSLGISVAPERFDALVQEVTKVGLLASISVQQQDRTGEFRRLHAQRQALKKHQEAILKLRSAAGLSVEETLKVEQKVQDVEKEIQALGVQLGDLLDREPSYNLFVTLQEYQPGSWHDRSFTLTRRLGHGGLWALGWWALAALGAGLLGATFVSIRTLGPAVRRPGTHREEPR